MFAIRELTRDDVPLIVAVNGGAAWNGGLEKWNRRLAEHEAGKRVVLLAVEKADILAYGSLLWSPPYPFFREFGIPELQDLVVAQHRRREGIGSRLIAALEQRARKRGCLQIGMGVGLYADYGDAQRLYVKLGYVPDGRGMTSRLAPALGGAQVRVDDDLLLWLVKSL
jgi:GNAT superfamily N-acetyltransferase